MKKIVRVGKLKRVGDLFLKIEFEDGKLSISGVEGPLSNGNAHGGCGQISMGYAHRNPAHNDRRYTNPTTPDEIEFAPGWEADKWLEVLEIWHNWHLNDMKPNCEHQVGPDWDTQKEITLYYFRLNPETEAKIKAAKDRALQALKSGATHTPLAAEVQLFQLKDRLTFHEPELPDSLKPWYVPNGPIYPGDSYNRASEKKTAGWVKPDEHPGGLLCKPCPVCGYKYGSEWKSFAVPAPVVTFLQSLPDADRQPAWV